MLYSNILIDVFNYYMSQKEKTYKHTIRRLIKNLEDTILPSLEENGKVYFLFDPLPTENLNFAAYSKSCATARAKISSYYKKNRKLHKEDIKGLLLFQKYLKERDSRFVLIINNSCEADDFVEPLLEYLPKKPIALISKDSDWCRYLNDLYFVTDYRMKRIITAGNYEEEYGYYPTIASVTMDKVLLGDRADFILNIFSDIRNKYKQTMIFPKVKAFLKELGESKEELDTLLARIKQYTLEYIIHHEADTAEYKLFKELQASEVGLKSNFMTDFFKNLELVKCRFDGKLESLMENYPNPNPSYCSLIDATIGIGKFKKPFKFGDLD